MKKEFRAIVRGRVQLVMYRDFAARTARRLGVSRTVRNLPDGSVEIGPQRAASARAACMAAVEGGRVGYAKAEGAAPGFRDGGVRHLGLYAFSTENWNRAPEE